MENLLYLIIILVVLGPLALTIINKGRGSGADSLPIVAKRIMTDHELAFAEKLVEAVDGSGLNVIPQISMCAFLQVKPGTEKALASRTRNRFSQKRPDFVLTDDDMNVVLIVELDDSTHNRDKDRVRDTLASAAGIKTVRFRNGRKTTVSEISLALAPHIRSTPAAS